MVDDAINGSGVGQESVESTPTPDSGGAGEQQVQVQGRSEAGQPERSDPKSRPLTQDAFDRQYRAAREAEEARQKAIAYAQEQEYRTQQLQQQLETYKLLMQQQKSSGNQPETDELERMARENAQVERDLKLLDGRYTKLIDPLSKKLNEVESMLRASQEAQAVEQSRARDANAINSIAARVHQELGLTDKGEIDFIQSAVTPRLMNLMSDPGWKNIQNQDMKWDIWRRAYREGMEGVIQALETRKKSWEQNYIETLKKNKGGIPITAGGSAPPAQVDDLLRKYEKGEISERDFLRLKGEQLGVGGDL